MLNKNLPQSLKNIMSALEQNYKARGIVSWATFNADPVTHQKKVVELTNGDLVNGLIRLRYPCCLKLTENIFFNPNRPTTWLNSGGGVTSDFTQAVGLDPARAKDWMPDGNFIQDNAEIAQSLRLGFFAAITVEAEDVIIDLNGYSIVQHQEHALMQPFYSHIELADQPFLMGQGPSATGFGSIIRSPNRTWIKNGLLGNTIHHCIHGNKCKNVLITDVIFQEYSVAAVSLNGAKGVVIQDCEAKGLRTNLPVNGQFSNARYGALFADSIINYGGLAALVPAPTPTQTAVYSDLLNANTAMKNGIDHMFNDIIFGLANGQKGKINTVATAVNNKANQAADSQLLFFSNFNSTMAGLIDGPAYGMLFYVDGVAINAFVESRDLRYLESCDIFLTRVSIENTRGNPVEIPSLTKTDGVTIQLDTAGAVFAILTTVEGQGMRNPTTGAYQGTLLSNLQVRLQAFKQVLPPQFGPMFSTLSIDPTLVDWAIDGTGKKLVFVPGENAMKLTDAVGTDISGAKYKLRYNGDIMHHVGKGVIGLRIEGTSGVLLEDVVVCATENAGPLGGFNVPYTGPTDGGHEKQSKMVGYTEAEAKGILFTASQDIELNRVTVSNTKSKNGHATGVQIINDCFGVDMAKSIIRDVAAGTGFVTPSAGYPYPNKRPLARGLHIDPTCTGIKIQKLKTTGTFTQPVPEPGVPMSIETPDVTII